MSDEFCERCRGFSGSSRLCAECILRAQLAAVTAERDALGARLAAVRVASGQSEYDSATEAGWVTASLSEAAARNGVLREVLEANAAAHDREPGSTPPCACVSCNRARAALSAPAGWCWWALGKMGDAPTYEAAKAAAESVARKAAP